MLVLSRRVEEGFKIGDHVYVKVLEVTRGRVKLGIDAPASVAVVRDELVDRDGRTASVRPAANGATPTAPSQPTDDRRL
jgi:carbon storage regulator CsrA